MAAAFIGNSAISRRVPAIKNSRLYKLAFRKWWAFYAYPWIVSNSFLTCAVLLCTTDEKEVKLMPDHDRGILYQSIIEILSII